MKVNQKAVVKILEEVKPATLVAATKYTDVDGIDELEANGCLYFGENRVQDFLKKYHAYQGKGQWHFIGTLQTNKVKQIIDKVDLIHSVDNERLIHELGKQSQSIMKSIHILLQVNIAMEKSKHGFTATEMSSIMSIICDYPTLVVEGLMMMAPHNGADQARVYFQQTRELLTQLKEQFPNHPLKELSMGMSEDYKVALEEGATLVRIGRALFKNENNVLDESLKDIA